MDARKVPICVLAAAVAWAGGVLTRRASAQRSTVGTTGQSVTVQLPTFQFFGVSTTVVVPDRGTASLGGGGSAAMSRAAGPRLLPPNHALGRSATSARIDVSVYVHDLHAMDESLLQQAGDRSRFEPKAPLPDFADRPHLQQLANQGTRRLKSVAELRRARASAESALEDEARGWFDKAEQRWREGQLGVARIYYQMVWRRAEGPLKQAAANRLRQLAPSRQAAR